MTTYRKQHAWLLFSLLIAAAGCDGSSSPRSLPPQVSAAVDRAYREILREAVARAKAMTEENLESIQLKKQSQEDSPRQLHAKLGVAIHQIRIDEESLFLKALEGWIPAETARIRLYDWSLLDAALKTRMEEMILRRFAATSGGYRYRLFEAIRYELQAFCEERRAAWLAFLAAELERRPEEAAVSDRQASGRLSR